MLNKETLFGYKLGQILSFLAILGGLITGYASIIGRLTAVETCTNVQQQINVEIKADLQRLSDKIDKNQETLIFYLKSDENKSNTTLRNRTGLVTFLQPSKEAAEVN